ncbi:MAG: hypothetical protein GXY48_05010 [Methanomicrobiales archaeon]|nr:hypothetical protein [Methanomicrobiales archaeon]
MNTYKILSTLFIIIILISFVQAADDNLTNGSPLVFSAPIPSPDHLYAMSHDYVLQKVTLSGDYTYTRPGRSVTPRIVIFNPGGDDTAFGDVPVEAWLGETQLIPVDGSFTPLKGGKSAMYTLRYMIPHDIPLMPCHLTLKIDPWNIRGEKGNGINELTTLALVAFDDREFKKL